MIGLEKTSTQEFVPIKEIRDGAVILNNGSLRSVIIATSINFALKSSDEKKAIILQYQNFLNSLDFQIQILVQSRLLDINPYIATLETSLAEQTNELLKIQITEYIGFIRQFVGEYNIMNKSFFIVVPYDPPIYKNKSSIFSKISLPGSKQVPTQEADDFEENKNQLEQRINVIAGGLNSIGIRTTKLETEELVELYFKIFNPGEKVTPTV
jgi:hypothetical protein